MHSKYFIHRDVKPDNFLIGIGKKENTIHVIDFGLAKQYRDRRTGGHIPYRDGKSLTGTARYASLNTHLGVEQSRRDDLESIGLVMVYLTQGSLPWQGLMVKSKKEKYEKIKQLKETITVEDLCKSCPPEFASFINYCRKLGFEEDPNYAYLRKITKDALVRQGYEFDFVFDWMIQRSKAKKAIAPSADSIKKPDIPSQTLPTKKKEQEEIKEFIKPIEKREVKKEQPAPYKISIHKQPVHIVKENGLMGNGKKATNGNPVGTKPLMYNQLFSLFSSYKAPTPVTKALMPNSRVK